MIAAICECGCATGCGRPTRDVLLLCITCMAELERDLAQMPALLDELAVTLTRQARISQRNGTSRGAEQPVPFHIRASDIAHQARNVLSGWVRVVAEDNPARYPDDNPNAMCAWLVSRIDLLARHEAAGDMWAEVTDTTGRIRHVIDRPADRAYAGACGADGCTEPLYAHPGAPLVHCRACDTGHDVASRRQQMLDDLDGRLMTVAEIVHLATYLGLDLDRQRTRNLLDKWVQRGRLVAHGLDREGRGLYPFGDTLREVLSAPTRVGVA